MTRNSLLPDESGIQSSRERDQMSTTIRPPAFPLLKAW